MFGISKPTDTADRAILSKELQKITDPYEIHQIKVLI